MQFYLLSPCFILLYVRGVKAGISGFVTVVALSTLGMVYGSVALNWSALTLGVYVI